MKKNSIKKLILITGIVLSLVVVTLMTGKILIEKWEIQRMERIMSGIEYRLEFHDIDHIARVRLQAKYGSLRYEVCERRRRAWFMRSGVNRCLNLN